MVENSNPARPPSGRAREPRPEKAEMVAEIAQRLSSGDGVVFTEYRGLNTKEMSSLRSALRQVGGSFVIYKNTMVRFAARSLEIDCEHLLVGPTALAFIGTAPDDSPPDASAVAKVLVDFRKGHDKLIIKGIILGSDVSGPDSVEVLSQLPSLDVLRAQLAGAFAAPLQRFAASLAAPAQNFAGLLKALIDKTSEAA